MYCRRCGQKLGESKKCKYCNKNNKSTVFIVTAITIILASLIIFIGGLVLEDDSESLKNLNEISIINI